MSNIAISYENTISRDVDFWTEYLKYLRLEGHLIYVIGHHLDKELETGLELNGLYHELHFDYTIPIIKYLKNAKEEVTFSEFFDKWRCKKSMVWWGAKARICWENGCIVMFEGEYRYKPHFRDITTRFVLTSNESVQKELKTELIALKAKNDWFEDYDSEFNVNDM